MKQRLALVYRVGGGDTLERVPDGAIRIGPLFDGKVTFEHRTSHAEIIHAKFDVGSDTLRQFYRCYGQRALVPIKTRALRSEAAYFDNDAGASGHRSDAPAPRLKDFISASGIRSGTQRCADVIENACYVREYTR